METAFRINSILYKTLPAYESILPWCRLEIAMDRVTLLSHLKEEYENYSNNDHEIALGYIQEYDNYTNNP